MKQTILLFVIWALFSLKSHTQTVTDYDGNVYHIVTIGTQNWLIENLKVTHFRNGDSIPNVTNGPQWSILTTGAYCNYNNDVNNANVYGRLYNWYAVNDNRNIAPTACHIPSDAEFTTLINFLGGVNLPGIGGKLKESGFIHWLLPNTGATNESGFTALPGGSRDHGEPFNFIQEAGMWWSTTEASPPSTGAKYIYLAYDDSDVHWADDPKSYGYSIRCICDTLIGGIEINGNENIRLYPNPATDLINIEYSNKNQSLILSIYDLIGNVVLQRHLGSRKDVINISSLNKGIYIIRISGNAVNMQRKLIKD